MKIAVAGDSAGEGLAKVLADHLKGSHEVAEISRTEAGPDAFYANLSDRVANEVLAGTYDRAILVCGTGRVSQIHSKMRRALYHSALISTGQPWRGVTTSSPTRTSIHVS